METLGVQLERFSAIGQADALDHPLIFGDDDLARTMSQPPTSSPSTKSCGIVGQPESADSSWRMRGSGRMSSAAYSTPSAFEHRHDARGEPAARLLGRALHEEHHVLLADRLLDELADLFVRHHVVPSRRRLQREHGSVRRSRRRTRRRSACAARSATDPRSRRRRPRRVGGRLRRSGRSRSPRRPAAPARCAPSPRSCSASVTNDSNGPRVSACEARAAFAPSARLSFASMSRRARALDPGLPRARAVAGGEAGSRPATTGGRQANIGQARLGGCVVRSSTATP